MKANVTEQKIRLIRRAHAEAIMKRLVVVNGDVTSPGIN